MAPWLAEYREGIWEVYILNWEEQTGSVNNLKKKKNPGDAKGEHGVKEGFVKAETSMCMLMGLIHEREAES